MMRVQLSGPNAPSKVKRFGGSLSASGLNSSTSPVSWCMVTTVLQLRSFSLRLRGLHLVSTFTLSSDIVCLSVWQSLAAV
eukprot:m.778837 g.778837  ORF g.778837 m.778837 type:complete len:80 (-) comp59124_c0_seq3:11-250(-)